MQYNFWSRLYYKLFKIHANSEKKNAESHMLRCFQRPQKSEKNGISLGVDKW